MKRLLCLCLLTVGCGPLHVERPDIPPRAVLTAEDEDRLIQDDPDPVVYVMGNVNLPGAIPFRCTVTVTVERHCKPLTVLQVLAQAGGFGEWAKLGSITVARDVGGEWLGYTPFNFKRILKRKPAQDFRLRPGDIVVVP